MANSLADRLAKLETSSTAELRARWEQAIKRSVPKRASRDLLLRALAYHVQEQAEGGLSKATRRRLAKLAGLNGENREPISPPILQLKPGSRLIREWRGEVHRVTVLEKGFDWRGNRYTSLSQIARAITGALASTLEDIKEICRRFQDVRQLLGDAFVKFNPIWPDFLDPRSENKGT